MLMAGQYNNLIKESSEEHYKYTENRCAEIVLGFGTFNNFTILYTWTIEVSDSECIIQLML